MRICLLMLLFCSTLATRSDVTVGYTYLVFRLDLLVTIFTFKIFEVLPGGGGVESPPPVMLWSRRNDFEGMFRPVYRIDFCSYCPTWSGSSDSGIEPNKVNSIA